MERYEIDKLRALPIEGVADRLGLKVKKHKALVRFMQTVTRHSRFMWGTIHTNVSCAMLTEALSTLP